MCASAEIRDLLVLLDAWPSACGRVWNWPMNESSLVLEVSEAADVVTAVLPDGAFPDDAGLCRVLKGSESDANCSGTCGACRIEMAEAETPEHYAARTRRFCERLCERMVAYEDRFLSSFVA